MAGKVTLTSTESAVVVGCGASPSLRKAINAKCKQCIYDQYAGEGTWRQQVEACTSRQCPLYLVRPISKPSKETLGAH